LDCSPSIPLSQSKSYANICEALKCTPAKVLFLTDIFEEAEAAKQAGLGTTGVPAHSQFRSARLLPFRCGCTAAAGE
jgi:methionine salvage enolase-phosphatase E1